MSTTQKAFFFLQHGTNKSIDRLMKALLSAATPRREVHEFQLAGDIPSGPPSYSELSESSESFGD